MWMVWIHGAHPWDDARQAELDMGQRTAALKETTMNGKVLRGSTFSAARPPSPHPTFPLSPTESTSTSAQTQPMRARGKPSTRKKAGYEEARLPDPGLLQPWLGSTSSLIRRLSFSGR